MWLNYKNNNKTICQICWGETSLDSTKCDSCWMERESEIWINNSGALNRLKQRSKKIVSRIKDILSIKSTKEFKVCEICWNKNPIWTNVCESCGFEFNKHKEQWENYGEAVSWEEARKIRKWRKTLDFDVF